MKKAIFNRTGRLALAPQAWRAEFDSLEGTAPLEFERCGDLAVVEICGPLTHHAEIFFDSYDAIRARAAAAFDDAQTSAVVLKIDSPGGDVAGCFELARELRSMATTHRKRLVAYADGMAASAAYALASSAEEIFVSPTSFVGSIGVIDAMCDQTAADAAMGLRYVLVTSGARKADGNPHVAISKEAVASMQAQVDGLASLFFDLVGEMRGERLSAEKARGLQAGMFFGASAVGAGLADRVTTWTELLAGGAREATEREKSGMPKASKYAEALDKLKESAEEGNEMAKKMLALEEKRAEQEKAKADAEDGDGDKDGDEKKPEGKKAEADDEKKAKAEADDEKKAKAEADDDKAAKAQAVAFEALGKAQALAAKLEAKERDEEIAKLFATRPDFDASMQATLSTMPIAKIREACEKWPRVGFANGRAAAATATGTRGQTEGTGRAEENQADADFIDRAMGLKPQAGAIRNVGRTLELGILTPAQARARVAELDKAAGKENV